MLEHNGRLKAKQFAEYITGEPLRQYVAETIERYLGKGISVFDGACGSGQLEQFVKPCRFRGVDIQPEAVTMARHNYPDPVGEIDCTSFFLFDEAIQYDCVLMNPPFSIKFKDLSIEEQQAIQAEFPWKKSGVVDDIFILKGMKYSKRLGFFIAFPGIGYRNTERQMRELIGHQLAHLIVVENGFEDTSINVLFLVIDKQKTSSIYSRTLWDAKTQKAKCSDEHNMTEIGEPWETIRDESQHPKETLDIRELTRQYKELRRKNRETDKKIDELIDWLEREFD
ncbi:N-6 DNA methylase [Lonepinella sp. BR2271]|uniref:N-6 DNA methylase n=1 Tax=Lonepinella sp. BR2271 TaxID=3434550 RepID=UPI003F6DDFB2